MATYLENLIIIRDSLAQELSDEAAYRAEHGPKPTYSIAGRSVSWMEYISGMQAAIKEATDQIIMSGAEGIVEDHVRGYV